MKAKDLAMYVLASLVTIGFFVFLYMMIFNSIPEGNNDVLNMMGGSLIASFGMVVSYFFGSSKGSADKNDMLKPKP